MQRASKNIQSELQSNNNPQTFLVPSTPEEFAERRIRILKKYQPQIQVPNYTERLREISQSLHRFDESKIQIVPAESRLEQWNISHKQQPTNVNLANQKLLADANRVIQTINKQVEKIDEESKKEEKKNTSIFGNNTNLPQTNFQQPIKFGQVIHHNGLHNTEAQKTKPPISLFPAPKIDNNDISKPVFNNTGLFSTINPVLPGQGLFDNKPITLPQTPQPTHTFQSIQPTQPTQPTQPIVPVETKNFNDGSFLFKNLQKKQEPISLFSTAQQKKPIQTQVPSLFSTPPPILAATIPTSIPVSIPEIQPVVKGLFRDASENKLPANTAPLVFNNQNATNQTTVKFTLKAVGDVDPDVDNKDLLKNTKFSAPTGLFNNAVTTPIEAPKPVQVVEKKQKPEQNKAQLISLFSTPQLNTNPLNMPLTLNNTNTNTSLFKPTTATTNTSLFAINKPTPINQQPFNLPITVTTTTTSQQASTPGNPFANNVPAPSPKKQEPKTNEIPLPKLQTNSQILKEKSLFGDSSLLKVDKQPITTNASLFSTPAQGSLFGTPTGGSLFGNTVSIFNNPITSEGGLGSGNMFSQNSNTIFNQVPVAKTCEEDEGDDDDDEPLAADEPQVQQGQMHYEYKSQLKTIVKFNAELFKRNQQQSIKHVIVSLQQPESGQKLYLFVKSKQTKRTVYTGIIIPSTICTLMSTRTNARLTPVLYINPANPKPVMDIIRIKFNEVANSEAFEKAMKSNQ